MASPFGTTATPVSTTAYKTGTVQNKPNPIGGVLSKLSAGIQSAPLAQSTQLKSTQPANVFGNTQAPVSPFNIGVQAKAPEQNISKPTTILPTNQTNTTTTPVATAKPPVTQTLPTVNPNTNLQTQGMGGTNTPQYSSSGGAVIPQGGAPAGTQVSPTQAPVSQQPAQTATPNPYTVNGGLYGQLITGLANRSLQPSDTYQQATKDYQNAVSNLANFRRQVAGEQANISQQPIELGFQQGRQQVLTQKAAQEDAALQNAVNQQQAALGFANTQQGLLQQALQQAAAGAAPTQVSPGNYLASPLGGGAQTAAEGQQQGIQSATNWNIAQQNIQQGRTYQGQAQDISNSLQLLQTVRPQLTSFMEQAGLNPATAPILNEQINKIDAQANPAAYRTMAALVAETRSFVQQMLQAQGGMTPTDAGNLVSSYDFGSLTPSQLDTFLQNMEVAGNYRLSQAQSASQAGYGANTQVGAPAQGMTAQQGGQLQTGGANQLNNLPEWLKVLGGVGTGVAGAVGSAVQGAAGNAAAGATGGLAAKVLGI